MVSVSDRVLYTVVFTDISASTTTGSATEVLFSATFFANKKAHQTHRSRILGSAFIVHFAHNIVSSASKRKAMGKRDPKPAYSLNIALLISKMYLTLKLVVVSDIFLMLAYLGKTFKEHGKNGM